MDFLFKISIDIFFMEI